MEIRPITPDDYTHLMTIKLASILSCNTHYKNSELQDWIDYCSNQSLDDAYGNSEGFLVEKNNRLIGYITYTKNSLDNIFILPEFQKQGVATKLMWAFHATIKQNSKIEVRASLNAVKFYEKHGYQFVKKSVSRAGFDMVVMEKTL